MGSADSPLLPSCAVVFPQDLLEKGLEADNFAMLGLGDVVIPGDSAGMGDCCKGWKWYFLEAGGSVKQRALPTGERKEKVSPRFGE